MRAWLRVTLRPGEAVVELRVSQFLTLLYPQDRRFYEAELDAFDATIHGREPEISVSEVEQEARRMSWLALGLIAALAAAFMAKLMSLGRF